MDSGPADGLSPSQPDPVLRHVVLVLALGALLVFPSFFTRGLWNPDEPRYMEVGREMVALGDYVISHLNGEVYPDKGPFFFWLTAGFYQAGLGLASGRMVSGLATLGTLLLVYFFGRRLWGARGGLLAAFLTATTFLFVNQLKAGVIDPLLMFLEMAAVLSAWLALHASGRRSRAWWLGFYAFCGLAILTKGPVGFFAPGIFLLAYALFNRKAVAGGGWWHLPGVLAMLAIVAAWLAPAMVRGGPDYYNDILFNQPAVYTVKASSHPHGPHYYFMILPGFLLPWTFFFGLGLVQAGRDWRRQGDRVAGFLAFWFIVTFLFFTAIPAKRQGYLLPIMPAAALLCARYFVLGIRRGYPWPRLHRAFVVTTFAITALVAGVLIAVPFAAGPIVAKATHAGTDIRDTAMGTVHSGLVWLALIPGLAVLAVSVLGMRRARGGMPSVWVRGGLVAIAVTLSLFADLVVMPVANTEKCSSTFCRQSMPYLEKAEQRYFFLTSYSGNINVYTGITAIPVIRGDDRDAAAVDLVKKLAQPAKVCVISDESRMKHVRELLPSSTRVVVRERMGQRSMLLLCNWQEEMPASH